ncbi:DUF3857 domain-containing protein [Alkalitalea saponilacus]|uniref:DUF3857 domain-containing protein n=1 Tax=Alkalitalea saponilacus TaxID=889453 RepID=A0A1T5CEZ4_9BACT|nr:DUF3857 domain-containing protein [Alkalitalea saponilacus]ASB49849.1 hypothetical protein CDL62_12240 [Alkalitalea saponilacus]SKB58014.1 protein of unknown function [Alkalitalea saponilacus]
MLSLFRISLISVFWIISSHLFAQELAVTHIPEELKKDANSVIRYFNHSVEITPRYQMNETIEWAVTIFNASGNYHMMPGGFYNNNSRIRKMQATVYDANGRQITRLRKRDIHDASVVTSSNSFTDHRIKYFDYSPGRYPYTIVFRMEYSGGNTAFIPIWRPIQSSNQSVEKSSFQLNYPSEWKLTKSERLFEEYQIEREHLSGIYKASAKSIPVINEESNAPAYGLMLPSGRLSLNHFQLEGYKGKAETWQEFGKWYYNNMLKGRDNVPTSTIREIELIKSQVGNDTIEMARRIFEMVQSKTRYIDVAIGIGGWKPLTVETVDQMGYGDCKALSFYTMALFRQAGIPAYYSIVHAGNRPVDIDTSQVAIQGNHIIVCVPLADTTLWVETTDQSIPFGFIGTHSDNRKTLVIKDDGAIVKRTTIYPDTLNLRKSQANIILLEDGTIEASVKIRSYGIRYDRKYLLLNTRQSDLEEMYKKRWSYFQGMTVKNIELNNDKISLSFEEAMDIEARSYGSRSGDRILIPSGFFSRNQYIPPRYPERINPLVIDRGYIDQDQFKFIIPEGYEIEAIPNIDKIETKFGVYHLTIEKEDDRTIIINRYLWVKSGTFKPELYSDYQQFRRSVASLDQSNIVLIKTNQQP